MNQFTLSVLVTIATLGCVNATNNNFNFGDIGVTNGSTLTVKKINNKQKVDINNGSVVEMTLW
jgi:hypothetical protein